MKYIFADHGIEKYKKSKNDWLNELFKKHIYNHFCLGHDLHLSRILVFHLLNAGSITEDDMLIVKYDRQFLYNNTFNNIITFDIFVDLINLDSSIKINNNNFLFLPDVVHCILYRKECSSIMTNTYKLNTPYWNETLIQQLANVKKYTFTTNLLTLLDNKFIVFIIRSHNNLNIQKYVDYNNKMNIICSQLGYKLILFVEKLNLNQHFTCDYILNNLEEYANVIKHLNCKYLIGETSGGLEMGLYFHNDIITILEFAGHYTKHDILNFDIRNKDFYKENHKLNLFTKSITKSDTWNFKLIYPLKYYYNENFDDVINQIC